MRKVKNTVLISIALVVIFGQTILAEDDATLEINFISGFSDNILVDSSQRSDNYTTTSTSLKIYPLSNLEFNLNGDYTYYSDLFRISNHSFLAGLTYIPLSDTNGFTTYLTGSFSQRKYRSDDADATNDNYNSRDYNILLGLGYNVSESILLRSGISYSYSGYDIDSMDNKNNIDIFAGFNFSFNFLGPNSFDFEGGYSSGNIFYIPQLKELLPGIFLPYNIVNEEDAYNNLLDGELKSFYLSPRISRPLFKKTGIAVTFSYKEFTEQPEDGLIYGYSSGYLSPWISAYEGRSVLVKVKSFIIPKIISEFSFCYGDKHFNRILESKLNPMFPLLPPQVNTKNVADRKDDLRRYNINFKFPWINKTNYSVEPSLNIEYTKNSSSIDVYNYDNLSVRTSIRLLLN